MIIQSSIFFLNSWWFVGIACEQFSVPEEICPGYSPQFNCTVEDVSGLGTTFWTVTVNGNEDDSCRVSHSIPNDMQTCGPNNQFESSLDDPVGSSYSSTLTMSSISPGLNDTSVECAGPARSSVIGTSSICIVGKAMHFSSS